VKEKTSRHRQKGKNMKLEEVNQRTKEAVDFLVAALESGHSEVLTAYLGAMAKFRNYSFGNIMLIARQKSGAQSKRLDLRCQMYGVRPCDLKTFIHT
jgi:DNA-binding phage protein